MTKLAAQLYSVRMHMQTPEDIDRGFERLAEDGWKVVQASGLGPIAPCDLKALADKYGLSICATHIPLAALQNDLDGVLRDHVLLDCPYIGLGAMPWEYATTEDGFKRFAALINPIAERIRDAGRTFVYHNHNFEFARFGARTGLDILLEECGSAVQFEPDTYWIQAGGGDVVKWLKKLSGRIDVVHFKDMVYHPEAKNFIMAEIGEGNLNWPDIIAVCREAGVRWHIVEQDECRRYPFDSLKISLDNLHAMGME